MRTHLWRKTGLGKFRAERKGFSSIVGAIFMVIIVWILATGYFMYTLSENTVYNEAIREKNLLELNALSESVQVTNTTYVFPDYYQVNISASVTNIGSLSVQFKTLWAYASSANYTGYNFTQLSNVNVRGGATLSLSRNVTISALSPGISYSFASWLITGRGNVVPLQKAILPYTNIVSSNTTQGIGSLMMDFQNFTYYNVTGSGQLTPFPNGASGYSVSAGGQNIAFRVVLTNIDQQQRTINLSSNSVFFSIFPITPLQVRGSYWYIVNVNATGFISSTYTPVILNCTIPVAVYFASDHAIVSGQPFAAAPSRFTGTAPVNLALVGQLGSNSFGQNIPFVSIKIDS